ncbi:uncharacterized protein LOC132745897 [Ruditapes philippinarum]|uniref:uncharacterized protein LOC132745897 n=1 Tax=Ruditapes philippinarum TaxID=129788 RepID=UPI00295B30C2|nr:uncharacterized protein LOC132745897 [Ruditapes philippinarum]
MDSTCSFVACFICFAWAIILDIAKFFVAGPYIHDDNAETICRDSTNIPTYLFVSSKLPWALKKLNDYCEGNGQVVFVCCASAYVFFYFIWLILGGAWIYPYVKPVIVEGHDQNCDASFLMFAVFAVTSDIVLTIILICFLIAYANAK